LAQDLHLYGATPADIDSSKECNVSRHRAALIRRKPTAPAGANRNALSGVKQTTHFGVANSETLIASQTPSPGPQASSEADHVTVVSNASRWLAVSQRFVVRAHEKLIVFVELESGDATRR